LLPKEEVFQENFFSTDASAKPELDGHPLKFEPDINVESGMFFCFFLFPCTFVCQDRILNFQLLGNI
jgi:hypothetical protein